MEYDETISYEIAPGVHWVGFADHKAGFSNNPYLIIDDDGTGILIDPGSRADEHFSIVKGKVEKLIAFDKIKYIIVHHQDPDLCASLPLFEDLIGVDNVSIITTLRTSLFIPYYGSKAEIIIVEDGDEFELPSGRKLKFITTPYVHFAGSFVTFDTKEQILFSSDIFAAFSLE
ncbi:MAG: MBL fold metallo-hydrolase, partial [Candidatus Heimdallarchaeaceae archaeon]